MTLALAKIKTKKAIFAVSVFIPGLFIAVLLFTTIAMTGLSNSINKFVEHSIAGNYLVVAEPIVPDEIMGFSYLNKGIPAHLKRELEVVHADILKDNKAAAKKYDIPFDETSVEVVFKPNPFSQEKTVEMMINPTSPAWRQYLQNKEREWALTAPSTVEKLRKKANEVEGFKNISLNDQASISYISATYLKDGREDFAKIGKMVEADSHFINDYLATYARNSLLTFTDQAHIKRFILPENKLRRQNNNGAIPVVITYQEAQKIFGKKLEISKKPASLMMQSDWTNLVKEKVNGQTYTACYRSQKEQDIISQTLQDNTERKVQQANGKKYQKPDVEYALPDEPCGDLVLKRDDRSKEDKALDVKRTQYEKDRGTYVALEHQLLVFQVVGLMDVQIPETVNLTNLEGLAKSLLSANYNTGAFIPHQMFENNVSNETNRLLTQVVQGHGSEIMSNAGIKTAILSFSSDKAANQFISQNGCPPSSADSCKKPWIMSTYGTNYQLIAKVDDVKNKVFQVIFPASLFLSLILLSFTMARLIADSRKEAAVFRALGAKRSDIFAIYTTYTFILFGAILLLVSAIALIGLVVLTALYSSMLNDYLQAVFGLYDQSVRFSFFLGSEPWVLMVYLSVFVMCFVAITPSLVRNIRRNPINDMK